MNSNDNEINWDQGRVPLRCRKYFFHALLSLDNKQLETYPVFPSFPCGTTIDGMGDLKSEGIQLNVTMSANLAFHSCRIR